MLARMFDKRIKGYRSMGYDTAPWQNVSQPNRDDYVIEYDQETLRALEDELF